MHSARLLDTSGYFFSDQPFEEQGWIEASQLAIILDCPRASDAECILEARALDCPDCFRLMLCGETRILDERGQLLPNQWLRRYPASELKLDALKARGWSLQSSSWFEWHQNDQPLGQWNREIIARCPLRQLESLEPLLRPQHREDRGRLSGASA